MKSFIIITTLLSSMLFSQYLQDGIYPECSYVIVDQEGWKIHKNQDGKTISMTPKSKHNEKPGKYSFDKFGNLVPFKECIKENSNKLDLNNDDIELDIDIEISLFKNIDFSVYGGMSMPIGDNLDMYEMAPQAGLDIKLGSYVVSINGIMYEYINESSVKRQILSNNLLIGYNLNFDKFYLVPSIGMFNRTQQKWGANSGNGVTSEGMDLGVQVEIGYNFGKISIYTSGNYSTTLSELEQTATFYNFGLKYNF